MNYSVLLNPPKLWRAIRRRVVQRRNIMQAIKNGKRRFANDPNFRPDLVPGYFVPRLVDGQDDLEILERIIAAYKKAKVTQKGADAVFKVSNEWVPIYERNLGPLMDALFTENIAELRRMYRNFFRDPCSTGLAGLPVEIPNLFSGGRI